MQYRPFIPLRHSRRAVARDVDFPVKPPARPVAVLSAIWQTGVAACRSFANTALAKLEIGLASVDDKIPQLLAAPVFSI